MTDGHESGGEAEHTGSDREAGRLRPARARRGQPKRTDKRPLAWIEEAQPGSLIIAFHLNNEKVQKIVTAKPKVKTLTREQERQERRRERDRERRERNRRAAQAARESSEVLHYPTIHIQNAAPFPGFTDREPDEVKSKPYGGVLSEADADTSKTYPSPADRKRFDDARIKAEEEWKVKQAALYPPEPLRSHKQATTASKIKCVNFGGWEIDTWHAAPYPEEYSKNRVLYICEFCLKYMNSDYVAWRHKVSISTSFHDHVLTNTAQMSSEAPSWRRDLPRRQVLFLRGRWPKESSVLPESLFARQVVPRFQDAILRCRALLVLRHDRK